MKPVRYSEDEIKEFTSKGYWEQKMMVDYWDINAEKWPEREALVDSLGTRLTWADAKRVIDRIALGLVELGLEKDERIAIQSPNQVEGFLTRLACEKAGLISIALMHTFRDLELKTILAQIDASVVVIPRIYRKHDYYQMIKDISPAVPSLKHVIVMGDDVPDGAVSLSKMMSQAIEDRYPKDFLKNRRIDATEVCYLQTTTGTTGIPKVIEWTPAARLFSSRGHVINGQLTDKDIICAVAPWSGSPGGTLTYYCAPMVGAKIALLHEYTAQAALEYFEKEKVTIPCGVPTQLAMMMQEPVENYNLSSIRAMRSAGGYLPPVLAQEVEERLKCVILGTYGSQDTGSISGISFKDPVEKRRGSVGKPLVGNEVKVVDDAGETLPQGEVGLLYFRGPQSSSGYYRDPEKTYSEAFDQGGWAAPGDLAKVDDDGYIVIAGRKKDIIIRGGQNIYPGEIESMLMAHPKVSNAALVAMPDKIMGEKACAFVICRGKEVLKFEEMVDYIKSKKLANYKIPERLEVVESFPLASDSKINKVALREIIIEKLKVEGKIE